MDDLRHDAALAGALLILELFDTSPGAAKHELLGQLVVIITEAIDEFERSKLSVYTVGTN